MASIFISHSSRDNDVAERVRGRLGQAGFESIFLDFDPENGIPAGRRWEDELYSELRKADVVVFLGTKASVDSKWCHAELALARALGRKIVPVILEPGGKHPLVGDTQWITLLKAGGDGLQSLADAIRRIGADPAAMLRWDSSLSPYPGLLPFDERRAGVFYGREQEVAAIVERLTWPHAEATERLVFVVGSSGSGKSSLVRAGVVPSLSRLEGGWGIVPPFTPEDEAGPAAKLAGAFGAAFRARDIEMSDETCRKRVATAAGLRELAAELLDAVGGAVEGRGVLVAVDQAERLATSCTLSERTEFLDVLVGALAGRGPLRAIMAARSDHLGEIVEGTALEGRLTPTVTVGRLAAERLAEVIARPAQRAGLDLAPGLVERMVEDTRAGAPSGGDPLPLLAFTLRQLYDRRREPTRITLDDYDAVGGVVGALRAEADRAYERLLARGREAAVISTLLELVHVESERDPTGRVAHRSRFDSAEWEVVEAFVDARLLTIEGDEPAVHVAHEALLREWPVLRGAIDRSRDELVARTRLERDAREWERAGRDSSYLAGGQRLEAAVAALSSGGMADLDALTASFLAASRRQAARGARRRRLTVGLGVAMAAAVVSVSSWLTVDWVRELLRKREARAPLVLFTPEGEPRFALDVHEVTYPQYRLCVDEGRCDRPVDTPGAPAFATAGAESPVVNVALREAANFCEWVGRQLPALDELRSADGSPALKHFMTHEGGKEWTRTPIPSGGVAGWARYPKSHDRSVRISLAPTGQLDVAFRCAASS